MSDAEAIAKMTPAEMATALGGRLMSPSDSVCDRCERTPEMTCQLHWIVNFRVSEATAASVLCLGCLMVEVHHHMRSQAQMDALVEDKPHGEVPA